MEISILLIPVMFLLNSIISGFFINKLEKNKFDVIVNILPLFGLFVIYLFGHDIYSLRTKCFDISAISMD